MTASEGRRRPLTVLIPRGLERFASQSGIGEAIRHQEKAVTALGHHVVHTPFTRFDAVHLNTPFPDTPLVAAIAKLKKAPVLLWAHSTEEDFRDSFTGANLIAPWFQRWIAAIYRLGDVVLTPTAYSHSLISTPKYGITAPIRVLSNGVDTNFFSPGSADDRLAARRNLRAGLGLPEGSEVVMTVGLQMVRKGILEWVELARQSPETTFVWYGRTDPKIMTADVAEAIAAAPSNCVFPGYVSKDTLLTAYRGADVFCFLTKEETEGIVLLEALACGARVLLSDIPIYSEWLPAGKVVHKVAVPPSAAVKGPSTIALESRRRAAAHARSVLRPMLDGALPDLSAAGREAALEVSMDRVAERLQSTYESLGLA